MPDLWLPGAQRLALPDTAPTDGGPAKAIAHITWDRNATKAAPRPLVPYENLQGYFHTGGAGVAPHVLWDPFTGRFTQYYPANSRSKSVADLPGGTRTNRAGKVVIQIEALFFPWCTASGKAYQRLTDTPCKGWVQLQAWVHSWGVPDSWPMGRPVNFDSNRSESVWEKQAGWYGHSQVPENDHQDPGSWPEFVAVAPAKPAVQYVPFPGASWFRVGRKDPIVAAMHDRLVAVGCNRYQSSANKDVIGSGDIASYEAWQRKCGFSGSAATWPPGRTTWDKLKVPRP